MVPLLKSFNSKFVCRALLLYFLMILKILSCSNLHSVGLCFSFFFDRYICLFLAQRIETIFTFFFCHYWLFYYLILSGFFCFLTFLSNQLLMFFIKLTFYSLLSVLGFFIEIQNRASHV